MWPSAIVGRRCCLARECICCVPSSPLSSPTALTGVSEARIAPTVACGGHGGSRRCLVALTSPALPVLRQDDRPHHSESCSTAPSASAVGRQLFVKRRPRAGRVTGLASLAGRGGTLHGLREHRELARYVRSHGEMGEFPLCSVTRCETRLRVLAARGLRHGLPDVNPEVSSQLAHRQGALDCASTYGARAP
jgi:hypothetical protein